MSESFWVELAKIFTSDDPELQIILIQHLDFALAICLWEPELSRDIINRARELKREYGEEVD